MRSSTLRSVFVAGTVALVILGAPLESKACEWLWPWNWCRRPAYTYGAPAPCYPCQPQACTPCAPQSCAPCAPQACYYVPQTSYRVTYRYTPVTTCYPVSSCDPCTGCATTSYRPVTNVVLRPAWAPYRSYRIVYGQSCAPSCATCTTPCGPCGVGGPSCSSGACGAVTPSCPSGTCGATYGVSGATYGVSGASGLSGTISAPSGTGSGCSSCAAGAAATANPAATAPSLLPGPGTNGPSTSAPPPSYGAPPVTAPGTAPSPTTGSSNFYRRPWTPNSYTGPVSPSTKGTLPMPKVESTVRPIPQPSASPASTTPPQLTPPNNGSTTGVFRQAVYVTTATAPAVGQQARPTVDPYDWHAARD